MLTRIRNANTAMHDEVKVPSSKQKVALAKILEQEGYLEGPRTSALASLLDNTTTEEYLNKRVEEGSEAAKALWESRQKKKQEKTVTTLVQQQQEEEYERDGHNGPRCMNGDSSGRKK